jgi:hypothetical protein
MKLIKRLEEMSEKYQHLLALLRTIIALLVLSKVFGLI